MIYVQFSDSTEQIISSYFSGPQDTSVFQNQGAVEASDPRWKVFYDAQPSMLQQYFPAPA